MIFLGVLHYSISLKRYEKELELHHIEEGLIDKERARVILSGLNLKYLELNLEGLYIIEILLKSELKASHLL